MDLAPGEIVSLTEVHAFWDPSTGRSLEKAPLSPVRHDHWGDPKVFPDVCLDPWWVVGTHDFQFLVRRFDTVESLAREVRSVHAYLPYSMRDGYVRSIDYEVTSTGMDGPESAIEAFIQLRMRRETSAEDLMHQLASSVATGGVWLTKPMLRSFAWDHYALHVGFRSCLDLCEFMRALDRVSAPQFQTMCFLLRDKMGLLPEAPEAMGQALAQLDAHGGEAIRGRTLGFVSRLKRWPADQVPFYDRFGAARASLARLRATLGSPCSLATDLRPVAGHDDLELRVDVSLGEAIGCEAAVMTAFEAYSLFLRCTVESAHAFDSQTYVRLPAMDDADT